MMPTESLTNLLVVMAVAFAAPVVLGLIPRLKVPLVVVEIVLGLAVGPKALNWVRDDETVKAFALVGLAFLLFLSGLEIDLRRLRGPLLKVALRGLVASVALAGLVGLAFRAASITTDFRLVAVSLTATSLGIVVGVLKQSGQEDSTLGQLVIAGASLGDLTAILALSLLFSRETRSGTARAQLLVVFLVICAVAGAALFASARSSRLSSVLVQWQDSSAQVRVRGAVALVLLLAVVAQRTGLELILGAFAAGMLVGALDRDAMQTHPYLRIKLDAVGFGFLIPVFFVASGMRFDVRSLVDHPAALGRVPLFLIGLLIVRALPALVYRSTLGMRGAVAAGLLQATSLPFLVTASMIGVETGAVSPQTSAAMVAAGLASALAFPAIAATIARTARTAMVNG